MGAPKIIIKPQRGWIPLNISELWRYRELLYFFTWRDMKVRYKQTALGALWAIIQPFFTMVIFSLFFGRLAKMPSDGIPYPIFTYVALIPWTFFAYGLTQSSNSLIGNSNLITKVYFPRLMVPLSSVFSGLIDFAISFSVLIIMMFYYHLFPSIQILWLPAFLLLALITALGVGLWLSALNVKFRDIRYAIPFLTQFWLFATPVAYPASLLSEPWKTIYGLNPMVGVVEGFRWILLNSTNPPGTLVLISTAVATLLLISGLYYFKRMEKSFADLV